MEWGWKGQGWKGQGWMVRMLTDVWQGTEVVPCVNRWHMMYSHMVQGTEM